MLTLFFSQKSVVLYARFLNPLICKGMLENQKKKSPQVEERIKEDTLQNK